MRWGDFPAGDEKNWWRMADVGPCGPCSELHYDRGAHLSEGPECVPDHSEHCPRWLEVWNLVFMEFELHPDRSLTPLPGAGRRHRHGPRARRERRPGRHQQLRHGPVRADPRPDARAARPRPGGVRGRSASATRSSPTTRRAVTFLVADGVLPSNEGRGYVLRRIMRRAIRHGRLLGRHEPFLGETAKVVIDTMADAYPHLARAAGRDPRRHRARGAPVQPHARGGRRACSRRRSSRSPTRSGSSGARRTTLPADAPVLPGDVAFRLHDTYGFPIDLTVELAAEYGVRADLAGFEDALAEQRERSRSGTKAELARTGRAGVALQRAARAAPAPTEFLGYETTTAEGRVVAILRDGVEYETLEAVARGRAARRGRGAAPSSCSTGRRSTPSAAARSPTRADPRAPTARSCSTSTTSSASPARRPPGLTVHRGVLHGAVARRRRRSAPRSTPSGAPTRCATTRARTCSTARCATSSATGRGRRARSCTRTTCGSTSRSTAALTDDEKRAIEAEVRRVVREDRPVSIEWMTMAEAQAAGADAFFDEKYGDKVRTIRVEGFSHELCGGTHCRASGQIGTLRHHRRAEHRLRDAPDRGGDRRGGRPADGRALRRARPGGRGGRRPDARRRSRSGSPRSRTSCATTKQRLKAGAAAGGRPEARRARREAPRRSRPASRSSAGPATSRRSTR